MSADLLKRLIEAGTPADLIAEVALLVGEVGALERRRQSDRDRQASRRHVTSRDTCDVTDSHDPVSLDKKAPQTPEKINPFPCVQETRARGWHRLPEGWSPTRALPTAIQAKVDQWPPGTLDDELASFRRWAANAEDKNGKGRKLDWDQAWRNWIGRRHDERYSRRAANSNHGLGKSAAAFAALNLSDDRPF